jgi:hypothetical protein
MHARFVEPIPHVSIDAICVGHLAAMSAFQKASALHAKKRVVSSVRHSLHHVPAMNVADWYARTTAPRKMKRQSAKYVRRTNHDVQRDASRNG